MKLITTQKPIVFCVFDVYWLQRCLLLQKPIDKAHLNPQRLSLVCCFFVISALACCLYAKIEEKIASNIRFSLHIYVSIYRTHGNDDYCALCITIDIHCTPPTQCNALPCIYESLVLHHVFVKRQRKSQ